jgi:hypothetical protein
MKPPRITVRRLMVAIAVVALALTLVVRAGRFRRLADYHLRESRMLIIHPLKDGTELRVATADDGRRIPYGRHKWHRQLWAKYSAAARSPWLPIAPDPPMPE